MTDFIGSFFKYQDYNNWFLNLNPLTKLNILFCLGVSAMFVNYWQYGFSLCILYIVLAFSAKCGKSYLKTFSVLLLLLGVFTLIIRQFSVKGDTVLFSLFGIMNITKEALFNGITTSASLLGFSGAIVLFFQTTQMRDLMLAFENKKMSHEVSYVVLASFQTIKDLKKNLQTIMESQKARGIETEGNAILRMKAFFPVLGPLVLGAIANTEEKVIAMDARAFSSKGTHSFLRQLKPTSTLEKIVVVAFDICFVVAIVLKICGII